MQFLKRKAVFQKIGRSRTSIDERIKRGVFPPPAVAGSGSGSALFLEHEVERVMAAEVAGASEEQLQALVRKLVAERQSLAVAA